MPAEPTLNKDALAAELREHLKLKYMGDCKCGKCQLVPLDLIERAASALAASPSSALLRQAGADIIAERERQRSDEHWTSAHDDEHKHGELAVAAACYALARFAILPAYAKFIRAHWPWAQKWWKPSNERRNLVKAGALIVAEIERLDRAALTAIKEVHHD